MTMLACQEVLVCYICLFHNDVLADESKGFMKLDKATLSVGLCMQMARLRYPKMVGLALKLEQIMSIPLAFTLLAEKQ